MKDKFLDLACDYDAFWMDCCSEEEVICFEFQKFKEYSEAIVKRCAESAAIPEDILLSWEIKEEE